LLQIHGDATVRLSGTAQGGTMNTARPLASQADHAAPDDDPLRLRVFPFAAGRQSVMVVAGEVDISNARALRDRLVAASVTGSQPLVVDLVDLEFCDLFGLDAMREAAAIAETAGVGMTFRGMSRRLRWLDGTFPFQMPDQRTAAEPSSPASHAAAQPAGSKPMMP
jgi:anti-anti-sigma regulatory factor